MAALVSGPSTASCPTKREGSAWALVHRHSKSVSRPRLRVEDAGAEADTAAMALRWVAGRGVLRQVGGQY